MKNDYRYYVYDYLIGSHILTIDTLEKKFRIDRSNIYGQIFSFDRDWENITSKDIEKAKTRVGYTFDKYVLEHFTDKDQFLDKKVICKTNDYNECIKAIAQYCAKQEGKTLEDEDMGYYKKYLIPEKEVYKIEERAEGYPKVELVNILVKNEDTVTVKSISDDYIFDYNKEFFERKAKIATKEDIENYEFVLKHFAKEESEEEDEL